MTALYERRMPSSTRHVLVTGATGTTGRLVRGALVERGTPEVTAAARSFGAGTPGEVRFDWTDPSTHAAALAGAQAAFLVPPPGATSPAEVMVPFLRRAVDAGLRRVVLLGAMSVEAGTPGVGEVYDAVARLVPEWEVLRPSWFMQNFVGDHQQARSLRADGVLRTATGDGRVPFIDAADIAETAAVLLLAPTAGNAEHVLTGPRSLSYDEVAAMVAQSTGRSIRHEHLTVEDMRDTVFADLPRDFAAVLAGMDAAISAGSWSTATDDVERITGTPPRSLERFVAAHRAELARS